jgi:hypothetical protein
MPSFGVQKVSQASKEVLEQIFKTVRKVMAYSILYLLAHVPSVDPSILAFDNATQAGQQAVARRFFLIGVYVLLSVAAYAWSVPHLSHIQSGTLDGTHLPSP